jgi:hypothetical protein
MYRVGETNRITSSQTDFFVSTTHLHHARTVECLCFFCQTVDPLNAGKSYPTYVIYQSRVNSGLLDFRSGTEDSPGAWRDQSLGAAPRK